MELGLEGRTGARALGAGGCGHLQSLEIPLAGGGGGVVIKTEAQSEDESTQEQLLLVESPRQTESRTPKGPKRRTGGPRRLHAQGVAGGGGVESKSVV